MKVRLRTAGLGSNMKIKTDKMIVCFNWLHEFKFSNYEILAELLELKNINYARDFFAKLIEQEYLILFTNANVAANIRFLALTQKGVNFLIANDILADDAKAYNFSRFRKVVTILHHVQVQQYVLKNIKDYDEVVWEFSMTMGDEEIKPDAIVFHKGMNAKIAIEYERWSKSQARILYAFYKHYENITKGYYAGVVYVFEDEADRVKYQAMFNLPEWERYRLKAKDSKPVLLSTTFKPSSVVGLNNCFKFMIK